MAIMVSWYALLTVLLIFLFCTSRLLTTPSHSPLCFHFYSPYLYATRQSSTIFYIFGILVQTLRLKMPSLKVGPMKETFSAKDTADSPINRHHQELERWKRYIIERRFSSGYSTAQDVVTILVSVIVSLISSNHGDENASYEETTIQNVSVVRDHQCTSAGLRSEILSVCLS